MKTYDEITENVLKGAKVYRQKIRRTQYAVSVTVMCTACALGLTLYNNLEKIDRSQPEQPTDSYTEFTANLPTMNAPNDSENGDILSSESPSFSESNPAESFPVPISSMVSAPTVSTPVTDPTEASSPEISETTAHESESVHTTAVPISTTARPPQETTHAVTTAPISTTAPPAIQTTGVHIPEPTTAPPVETVSIPETTEYVEPTEWIETETVFEEIPETSEYVQIEDPTEPIEDPTEIPEPTDPQEGPTTEPTETTAPNEPTETTEPELSELDALKQAYPELQLSDEEWQVLFLLYSDSDLPFAFWYEMFGGTP